MLLGVCSQGALAFDVKVEGIDGKVLDNVNVMLMPVKENSVTEVRQTYRAQVDRAIRRAVQALGYYQTTIQYNWKEPKDKDPALLVAKVHLGEPARIEGTSFSVEGEGKDDEVFTELRKKLPKKGTQLNHGEYESFKASIERAAIRHGYFDGEFVTKELGVDAVKNQAFWTFDYDAKTRYRFGDIKFTGSQIREPILVNLSFPLKKASLIPQTIFRNSIADFQPPGGLTPWWSRRIFSRAAQAPIRRCLFTLTSLRKKKMLLKQVWATPPTWGRERQ